MARSFKYKPMQFFPGLYYFAAIVYVLLVLPDFYPVFASGLNDNSGGNKEIIFVSGNSVTSFYRNELIMKPSEGVDDNRVHMIADTYPRLSYPGGIHSFIDKRLEYPERAITNNTEGVVLVNFIVEKDGSISNISILRGIGDGCDEEVIKVLENLPVLQPGTIATYPVRIAITLPVRFKLKH